MRYGFKCARLATVAVLSTLLVLATASFAFAATGEPTLGLSALQEKVDAAGADGLPGYFKTVVRGSLIETIPVRVVGLTGDSPSTSFIMFKSYGPTMEAIGGIASGMSGSPIYVEDEGVDKVIGAVAYGDAFSLEGAGLATPIESMLQLVSDYAPRTTALSEPVLLSGRLIDRVIVSSHPERYGAASASGAFVARPLAAAYIGGLRPGTAAYENLAQVLSANHVTLVGREVRLSAGGPGFSADLEPGASVGAIAARGDMWLGGIGTVSYANGDTVLAFGHPMYWSGSSELYMTNAWITGVWGSIAVPYKIGYPSAVRGTVTQDRSAGIMGVLGTVPQETAVTAAAARTDTGADADSDVRIASAVIDSGDLVGAVGSAASVAGYRLFDTEMIPGSANTTTTIVVSDGTDEHTVRIANVVDDSSDVAYAVTADVDNAVRTLVGVLDEGVEAAHIVSVDLQSEMTAARRNARIVGVDALEPLHYGDNTVRVSLQAWGRVATQTVDVTLAIPEDEALTGMLTATSLADTIDPEDGPFRDVTDGPRRGVAQVVEDLNGTPSNDLLIVGFTPAAGDDEESMPSQADDAVEATASTGWVLRGRATAEVTQIEASAGTVTYGDTAWVTGTITGPAEAVDVRVYSVPDDGSEGELLSEGEAELSDGELFFMVPVDGLTARTELRVAVDGGDGFTPAETFVTVPVRARIRLSASPKTVWRGSWVMLTATASPRAASGSVKFQCYDTRAKKWRTLITKRLSRSTSTARATCTWRPYRGTWKVRAVYGGNGSLLGATSSTVTIRVR